jgi:hypothetical protein
MAREKEGRKEGRKQAGNFFTVFCEEVGRYRAAKVIRPEDMRSSHGKAQQRRKDQINGGLLRCCRENFEFGEAYQKYVPIHF